MAAAVDVKVGEAIICNNSHGFLLATPPECRREGSKIPKKWIAFQRCVLSVLVPEDGGRPAFPGREI